MTDKQSDQETDDIFGSDEQVSDSNENDSEDEKNYFKKLESGKKSKIKEEKSEEMDVDVPVIEMSSFLIPKPDKKNELLSIKPTIISIQPEPFNTETYDAKDVRPELEEDKGKKNIKLKPDHFIRWRYVTNKNGDKIRQSNARIVKWSDNTKTLFVGKEAFGIKESKLPDQHHLFARHKIEPESYYEMHGLIKKKITINASKATYMNQLEKLKLRNSLMFNKKKSSLLTLTTTDPGKQDKTSDDPIPLKEKDKQPLTGTFLEDGAVDPSENVREINEEKEKEAEKRMNRIKKRKASESSEESDQISDSESEKEKQPKKKRRNN
jgi:RNA polymerase-associated protein LEO1